MSKRSNLANARPCWPDGGRPHTATEWIEFIIVAVLLWLLMVVAISELELNSVNPFSATSSC
jgi:hypothetical protein